MYYNSVCGHDLSALGFGLMRLPTAPDGAIDKARLQAMVDCAMASGVNYFDTAWPYHAGKSEIAIRDALAQYPRESYFLADKYPGHQIADSYDPAAVFEKQLKKCGVDYFDFYLLHNVNETSLKVYLDQRWGIIPYFLEQRRLGRIRHLGFSCHGRLPLLREFLDKWGHEMEFCQIQLNYLDWTLQDAKGKVEAIAKHGLKVVVMEGIRGGRLADLPDAELARLQAVRPDDSPARWALRWLQSLPEVAVVLSGMSTLDQIVENVETFDAPNPVSDEEKTLLGKVAESMLSLVPCTACRYCTEGCPMELEIPKIIAAYNGVKNGDFMARYNPDQADPSMDPRRCIACGSCTAICPQGIAIPDIMADFAEKLTR